MKILIQSNTDKTPQNESHYSASKGFKAMGFETVPFCDLAEAEACSDEDMVVGGVGTIRSALKAKGINVPEINYPEELVEFYGRKMWISRIDEILQDRSMRPVFVKPDRLKRFPGTILRTENDVPDLSRAADNELVHCSEVVSFASEWRAFIRYGRILDVRPYKGDWRKVYNPYTIAVAVDAWKSAPAGCALDFGVTSDGRTLVIEANDGYSLGSYGLPSVDYAKLLSARWAELTGSQDECDFLNEKRRWKGRE